ncbi:hypothetical protein [Streptomyces luteolus]|uniref:Uncharacterized protein n=1 Tax=Streptomyces luteolus TaxID=3043615 RepID=A0ABT6SQN4_9ACTN|nr:hypothetical protein [Streptomyces sp. B-S-A12]MDI3417929.1 hypothetical protein [Streptomyces sp. B-S-A12]
MNLAKDNTAWQRTLSVTPLTDAERRKAALYVAGRAVGRDRDQLREDVRDLLEHLGLLDPRLHGIGNE